jgi:glycosyltransferase involved in cell wall biosynthesis
LKQAGFTYKIESFIGPSLWKILYKPGHHLQKIYGIGKGFINRFKMLFYLNKYDFVFIHREATPIGPPLFEWIITKLFRKRVIYDFDDAIWLSNTSEVNRWVAWIKWHGKVAHICRWAHKVSVGNRYLFEYARQYNKSIVLNPTTVDTEALHNRAKLVTSSGKTIIGWTGTHSTLTYLRELLPILQNLEKKFRFEFCVIADQPPTWTLKSLRFIPWKKATEVEDLLQFDIGVMPLTNDRWAKGKCGFKALQYMALGIPPIVSPVGVNQEIVEQGSNGFLCSNPEDWEQALTILFLDAELRAQLGKNARKTVESKYSVLANAKNFAQLFSEKSKSHNDQMLT